MRLLDVDGPSGIVGEHKGAYGERQIKNVSMNYLQGPLWQKYLISRTLVMLLSGLTMGLTFAHVLELPQRLQYDAELWFALTRPNALYRYFGVVGGPIEVAAVLGAIMLAVVLRRKRPSGRLALAAACCHIAALAAWVSIVAPANAEMAAWRVGSIPEDWETWRIQWEAGHATGFGLLMPGFCLLLSSLLREDGR